MRILAMIFSVLLLSITPTFAQQQTIVTVVEAKIFLEPADTSKVMVTVPEGTMLKVVAATSDWAQVVLPKDSSGFERTGFVRSIDTKPLPAEAAITPPVNRESMPVIAVRDFEYGAVKQAWSQVTISIAGSKNPQPVDVGDVGRGISNLLVEELLNIGTVRLIERSAIEQVIEEQDLANSNRAAVTAKEAAQLRSLLGARYLVMGAVTKFGGEEKTKGGIAGAIAGKIFLGGFQLKNTRAYVNITARIVDASTGEILGSATGQGISKRTGVLLGALGGGNTIGGGGINMGSSDFKESILGEATQAAVKELAKQLVARLQRMTT